MSPKGLEGPFTLTAETVKIAVTAKFPGVYALGHSDMNGTFIVESVGRSNENLQEPLQYLAAEFGGEFSYQYSASAKEAFEKECELHHEFLATTDAVHPNRVEGSYWKCPRCNVFD